MTRQEFDKKFKTAFDASLQSIDEKQIVKCAFETNSNNGKSDSENMSKSILAASTLMTEMILKSVLSELLPLDE